MAKKNENAVCFRTSIGGQALMEGILMRGPDRQAIVCRTKDGLVEKTEPIKPLKERCFLFGWPVVRGVAVFADSMIKGMKALTYSAELLPEEEQEKDKIDLWLEKKLGSEKAEKAVIAVAAVLGLALAVALFIVLPTFLIGLIPGLEGQYGPAQPAGGRGEAGHPPRLSLALLEHEGHEAHLLLSRRGAQDDILL